jgi:cytochrome c553
MMASPEQWPEQGGRVRRLLRRRPLAALVTAAVLGGAIFFIAAPLNIAARIGPYPGVAWVIHTYMQHWTRSWSMGVEQPDFVDLSDPELIRLGAGHFETGCAPCHGAPGRERNPLVKLMEPAPPDLEKHLSKYDAKQLYWIVWNGIRYTGMPGWTGKNRQDEVWAVVAFLEKYRDLDAQGYDRLAYGAAQPHDVPGGRMSFGGLVGRLDETMQNCARCHGEDGMGRDGTAPKIAGQSQAYLLATLRGYATGERSSGIMQPIAAPLSGHELQQLAAHYARMRPSDAGQGVASGGTQDGELMELGRRLAARGDPSRFVPPCGSCHEDERTVSPRAVYPRIAGQERRFIEAWLHLYRERPFGGTDFAEIMHFAAMGLTDRQIEALAAWYSSMPYRGLSTPAPGPTSASDGAHSAPRQN